MYKLSNAQDIVINTQDGSSFDVTSGHPFAVEYLQWLEAGNVPMQADAMPTLPIRVSAAQFHMALIQLNLFNQVQTETAQNQLMQVFFERSPYFVSDDPKIISVANALGLQGQIGAVFALAETL